MLRSDFEVLRNVYHLLQDSILSDEDASFLLGKSDGYFFEILDPTNKKKFKQDLWTLFVPIFQTPFVNVLPSAHVGAEEEVKLTSTANYNKKSTIYRFTVNYEDRTEDKNGVEHKIAVEPEYLEWKKKVVTGERKVENKPLTHYLKFLISEGFFFTPKTSLFVLIHLRKYFDKPFTAEDLGVSIRKLCRRQAGIETLLQRNIDDSRYSYSELYDISALDEVSELPEVLLEMASSSTVTARYKIKHQVRGMLGFIELNNRELVNIAVHPNFREMRMAARLLDYVMALDKKAPLTVEVNVNSPFLDFLTNCSFTESEEDRKFRKANKEVVIIKMKRGTKKEEENG
ncbi:hypothetical protein SAMN05660841_03966 [Sphingobacterium nematocida]|uniref:N-acetyltransferase domain-containing protein n=1 Tax=Sphingobacterium nematocida TaxID=1513896 RepID=A0A1T5GDQ2_9SPHI|nr:hypothetical protein [Sphingobacterium nematocida]SKC06491.1 hypothetical protein SAMN05660841_03966 [Sphingobacterium nematocida]